jgi:hypothetical protein
MLYIRRIIKSHLFIFTWFWRQAWGGAGKDHVSKSAFAVNGRGPWKYLVTLLPWLRLSEGDRCGCRMEIRHISIKGRVLRGSDRRASDRQDGPTIVRALTSSSPQTCAFFLELRRSRRRLSWTTYESGRPITFPVCTKCSSPAGVVVFNVGCRR